MLNQYEELAVLEQGEDGAVVSIRGQGGPSVLLGSAYLGHLDFVVKRAQHELGKLPVGSRATIGLRTLVAELNTLLAAHANASNKFEGDVPPARAYAKAMEELEAFREELSRW